MEVKLFSLSCNTQEADRPDCSTSMPKVVVGVPQVLKVFSWGFIYIFHKKILDLQVGLGLLKMVLNDFTWPKTWV